MVVRQAYRHEIPALLAFATTIFEITFAKDNNPNDFKTYLNEAFTLPQFEKEFDEPGSVYLVVEAEGGHLIGYARLRRNAEVNAYLGTNQVELQRFYIDVAYQGKGIADALMAECLKVARHQQVKWMWLGVWEHNLKAQRYYLKHGFEKFSEHHFMVGTDRQTDWLMKKMI